MKPDSPVKSPDSGRIKPAPSREKPSLTADAVLFRIARGRLEVLLVRRRHAPFKGAWAFPGGFVDKDEPISRAASRELFEETGMRGVELAQLRSFGDPGRDPRGWVVTVAHVGAVRGSGAKPRAGDDAAAARWFGAARPPRLAFDHALILGAALEWLRGAVMFAGYGRKFLEPGWVESDLAAVFSAVLGTADGRSAPD